jgi:glycosyltransferase involved in cell wall biosynthesis
MQTHLMRSAVGGGGPVSQQTVALVGTYPPQKCGIATFTEDLRNAIRFADPHARTMVCAMKGRAEIDYPPAVSIVIERDNPASYERAAARLNASGVDVISLQHEFGIFGGAAGGYILRLIDHAEASVATTLHTISPRLGAEERRVLRAVVERSDCVVTMARMGFDILVNAFGVDPDKIAVVPHGVPAREAPPRAATQKRLGLNGRKVLLSFGLISRGKGLETMIRAMPRIAQRHPQALYVILGATHPAVFTQEGESYRQMLTSLAAELGVERNVLFINRYAGADELVDYLAAADLYVTPYLNEEQITSGTLSYAYALGVPVISTPYWHAAELLRGDRGVLVPFGDSAALADAADRLLSNPDLRNAMSRRAILEADAMRWPSVGARYLELFAAVSAGAEEAFV